MSKLFSAVLVASALLMAPGYSDKAVAQTCTAYCRSNEIRFTPGQRVSLQLVNLTAGLVQIQQSGRMHPYPLRPGQEIRLFFGEGTQPNLSLLFWDEANLPVRTLLFRPEDNVLRVEFLPSGSFSDRSISILDDGRVVIY
ncbi:MAG: hypothetical protein QNJ46_07550 [Leptolyngbyaceae cyanobacterium MO_188.B28]|nr:hypothetical protein [Leptolyngbyaceae cyanobacterium MO_188.B28]